jgi:hypothetical protein
LREEFALTGFEFGVACWRRIWDPEIDLELVFGVRADFFAPSRDLGGSHGESAACAEASGVDDGDGERGRAGSGHGSEEYGGADAEKTGEAVGSFAWR